MAVEKIGKYTNLEKIGRGAMGVVYKGFDPLLERDVAVKMMSADFDAEPELLSRFFREARVAVQLEHPNIIRVYDLAEEGGRAYIVMELLDGEDLQRILKRGDPIPLEDRLDLMINLCGALAYAHGQDVVHRDLKPGNIHLTSSGEAKILDFGLARIADSEMTATGMVMGTPSYMSPEQVEGKKVDHRSDIFSLGVVFYEFLSFKKPFGGESLAEVLLKIAKEPPEPLCEVNPAVPRELSDIILKSLEKSRAKRYQSMEEMAADLREVRQLLPERLQELRERAKGAFDRLARLRDEHRGLLEEAEKSAGTEATAQMPIADLDLALAGAGLEGSDEVPGGYFEVYSAVEGAQVECQRVESLVAKFEWISSYPLDELAEQNDGEIEAALERVDEILMQYPMHERGKNLKERLTAEMERRDKAVQVDHVLERAEALRRSEDLEGALEALEEALEIDELRATALSLQSQISQQLEDRKEREQKAREAEEALQEARRLLDAEEFASAHAELERAVELDSQAEGAAELREEIARAEAEYQARREREERARKAKQALEQAREAVGSEEFDRARDEIARALELDAEVEGAEELRGQLERAEAEMRERLERQRRIEGYLEEARRLDDAGEESGALKSIAALLDLDPGHTVALDLRSRIEERKSEREEAERQRQEELAALLQDATAALEADQTERATQILARLLEKEPEHAEGVALRVRVEKRIADLAAEAAEKERLEREAAEAAERERQEREAAEAAERERLEKEAGAAAAGAEATMVMDEEPAAKRPAKADEGADTLVIEEPAPRIPPPPERPKPEAPPPVVVPEPEKPAAPRAARPPSGVAALLESPAKMAAAAVGGIVAIVILVSLYSWVFGGAAAEGLLFIDATPWARIAAVVDEEGNPVELEAEAATPLSLRLPPGRYEVQLTRPESGESLSYQAEVASEQTATVLGRFDRISAQSYFEQVGY